ncbi:MAG: hypothetical protein Cons2KO_10480 [Congregibacter sp.]
MENFVAIEPYLSRLESSRYDTDALLRDLATHMPPSPRVLDLGCGAGTSIDWFQELLDSPDWHGVDIADSPEVRARTRHSTAISTFDGINLPYANNSFDLIFSNQVLEHVRHPDALMCDAFRVLRPGGIIAGAVSYLEPFHSYSVFNFTPYGIAAVLGDAGFTVTELRAGSDASRLLNRQLMNRSQMLRIFWNPNYVHLLCSLVGGLFRLDHAEQNFLKLQFAGHIFFKAKKTEDL